MGLDRHREIFLQHLFPRQAPTTSDSDSVRAVRRVRSNPSFFPCDHIEYIYRLSYPNASTSL